MGFDYSKIINLLGVNASTNAVSSLQNLDLSRYGNIFDQSKISQIAQLTNTSTDVIGNLLNGSGYTVQTNTSSASTPSLNATTSSNTGLDISELAGKTQSEIEKLVGENTNSSFWDSIGKIGVSAIFGKLDVNKNGKLDKEELTGLASLDGENDNISLSDLTNFFSNNNAPTEIDGTPDNTANAGGNTAGAAASNVPSGGNATNNAPNAVSSTGQTGVEAIQGQTIDDKIKDAENKISEDKTNEKDATDAVQKEDQDYIKAVNDQLAGKTEDQNTLQNLNNKVTADDTEIATDKANLGSITDQIDTANNNITELKAELSQIPDGKDSKNDKDSAASDEQKKALEAKRAEIQAKITEEENKLKALEPQKQAAQTALDNAEKQKAEDIKARDAFVDQLAQNDSAIKDIKTNHDTATVDLQAKVDAAKTSLEEHKQALTALRQQKGEMTGKSEVNKYSNFNASFDDMLAQVLQYEGGYSNDPDDRGGATNLGITEAEYRLWTGDANADVRNITKEEATKIYYKDYYQASGAEEIAKTNKALSFAVFDAAVNHGVGKAQEWLKQCNGSVDTFMELREQKYIGIVEHNPSQAKFEKGWQNRWNKVYKFIDPNHEYVNYTGS